MEIMGDDWYTWGDWAKDFDPDWQAEDASADAPEVTPR